MWHPVSNILEKSAEKVENVEVPTLQNFLSKRYTLFQQEMYDLFLNELGLEKAVIMKAISYRPTVSLLKENEEYCLMTNYEGEKIVKIKFIPDIDIERKNPSGLKCQSFFTVTDNKLIEKLLLNQYEITIWREFRFNKLKVTMKLNNVVCLRYFLLDKSKHSIETETSRRGSLFQTITESDSVLPPEETNLYTSESSTNDTESEIELCF